MTVHVDTLKALVGKQVILHLIQSDGSIKEVTGKIEGAAEVGVAFKEKGKREVDLVEPDQIEEVSEVPSKPKSIPQKKLRAVEVSSARSHLLERHGALRSEVNALTDQQAFDLHAEIDHSDLGHTHKADEAEGDAEATEED